MKHTTRRTAYAALIALALLACGCASSRHEVRVSDAVTGKPISHATVTTLFPSASKGITYETSSEGVAHFGDRFEILSFPCSVIVTAPGYEKLYLQSHPTVENPSGWTIYHLEVALKPTTQP